MRRSAWMGRLKPAQLAKCPKCATPKLPHVVCQTCGYYKGKKVLDIKHRVTRSERRAAAKAAAAAEHKGHDHSKESGSAKKSAKKEDGKK